MDSLTAPIEDALAQQTDREEATIAQLIQRRCDSRIHQLEVELFDNNVRLSGRCATFYTKQLAQHAAMQVVCGATIINEIDVGWEER